MFEEGGETRINTAIASAISFIIALMLAIPVSAGTGTQEIVVQDRTGDLMLQYDADTCDNTVVWPDDTPIAQVGYFDMLRFWLSQEVSGNGKTKTDTYSFGMELAAELPQEGSPLPYGFDFVAWLMWIDVEPWNPVYNPDAETLFTIQLVYDGSTYVAELRKGLSAGPVLEYLNFGINGSEFELKVSAASIGDMDSFWWMPCTRVQWGILGSDGFWSIDTTDPGAVDGQVWWDIPWTSL